MCPRVCAQALEALSALSPACRHVFYEEGRGRPTAKPALASLIAKGQVRTRCHWGGPHTHTADRLCVCVCVCVCEQALLRSLSATVQGDDLDDTAMLSDLTSYLTALAQEVPVTVTQTSS